MPDAGGRAAAGPGATVDRPVALRPATPGDARAIWEWRNEPAARAASFSADEIPWQAHARWYAARVADPWTRIYVVVDPGTARAVGYVRFAVRGGRAEISVGLEPAGRGRGWGRAAIAAGCERLLAELPGVVGVSARVKPSNVASLRAFRAAGFADAAGGDAATVVLALRRAAACER